VRFWDGSKLAENREQPRAVDLRRPDLRNLTAEIFISSL